MYTDLMVLARTAKFSFCQKPPTLEAWRRVTYNGRDCIEGELIDFPGIDEGELVRTPRILHLDRKAAPAYVVTVSGWFKLGKEDTTVVATP